MSYCNSCAKFAATSGFESENFEYAKTQGLLNWISGQKKQKKELLLAKETDLKKLNHSLDKITENYYKQLFINETYNKRELDYPKFFPTFDLSDLDGKKYIILKSQF